MPRTPPFSLAFVTSLLLFVTSPPVTCRPDCARSQYDECVRIADPLVKQAHLVFPDNMDDLDRVCRTWNRFVDCLKSYTDHCFTDQQRQQFNKAVENPIESVHLMCTQPNYQKEYLRHAPCLKNTITEPRHCATHYNLLVDQVSQGEVISKSTLCCSHDRFKQCVLRETRKMCDNGAPDGPASRFSGQIIDKALSFLQDQCYNYIPNSGDCSTSTTSRQSDQSFSDPLSISTSSSEVYPWSTVQELGAKEVPPSRVTPPRQAATSSWLPPASVAISEASPTSMLGSRTRPASYGRSNGWSPSVNENQNGGANTVQMYPELTSTQASRPDWTREWTKSWQPQLNNAPPGGALGGNRRIEDGGTSTTWYPAAGDQLGNEVEEPNQLGLRKTRNAAIATSPSQICVALVMILSKLIINN